MQWFERKVGQKVIAFKGKIQMNMCSWQVLVEIAGGMCASQSREELRNELHKGGSM